MGSPLNANKIRQAIIAKLIPDLDKLVERALSAAEPTEEERLRLAVEEATKDRTPARKREGKATGGKPRTCTGCGMSGTRNPFPKDHSKRAKHTEAEHKAEQKGSAASATAQTRTEDDKQAIMHALASDSGWMGAAALKKETRLTNEEFTGAISLLVKEGKIIKKGERAATKYKEAGESD